MRRHIEIEDEFLSNHFATSVRGGTLAWHVDSHTPSFKKGEKITVTKKRIRKKDHNHKTRKMGCVIPKDRYEAFHFYLPK